MVLFKVFTDFFIFVLNMVKVFFPGIEIMLIFPAIVAAVAAKRTIKSEILAYYFCTILACSS